MEAWIVPEAQGANSSVCVDTKDNNAFVRVSLDISAQPFRAMSAYRSRRGIVSGLGCTKLRLFAGEALDCVCNVVVFPCSARDAKGCLQTNASRTGVCAYHRLPIGPFVDARRLEYEEYRSAIVFHGKWSRADLPRRHRKVCSILVRTADAVKFVTGGHDVV